MIWQPAEDRYDKMVYRRCGRSGLKLPAISFGLWRNFGSDTPHQLKVALCAKAFDLGITHFDMANTYGPTTGWAELSFGQILRKEFAGLRDEITIATKAGYQMWPGPYGEWGSRKYMLASLDQSLRRIGIDYVDIFYSHRFDPDTPLEETMAAFDQAVRSGKALYVGISSYNAEQTRRAAAIAKDLGTPLLINQPPYSIFNRRIEQDGLFDALDDAGMGSIAFSPLSQGMLTDRYLNGIPADSRVAKGKMLRREFLNENTVAIIKALNDIAARRGQSLAQMALAWTLRSGRLTSALTGATKPEQIEGCVRALDNPEFTDTELDEIEALSQEAEKYKSPQVGV